MGPGPRYDAPGLFAVYERLTAEDQILRVYVPIVYVDDHLRVLIAGHAWPADCDAVEHMFGVYLGLHVKPDTAQPVWTEFL